MTSAEGYSCHYYVQNVVLYNDLNKNMTSSPLFKIILDGVPQDYFEVYLQYISGIKLFFEVKTLFSGTLFDLDDVMTSEKSQIKGMMLLVCAESEEEVLEQLKKDVCNREWYLGLKEDVNWRIYGSGKEWTGGRA
ncbi:hypothetical protein BHYA_0149g00200 [Botrytis hyacinthi]|uniref:Uncharacterized protein n=1 Tax=Botrytis hyacinthi TaxID=278943 RepID=A0A4Z1GPZ9_9HELO|nr:hypothetical protein BHYA_0149g00200 [Botrytis hyacinthi]